MYSLTLRGRLARIDIPLEGKRVHLIILCLEKYAVGCDLQLNYFVAGLRSQLRE
jgi:hypothetical protein